MMPKRKGVQGSSGEISLRPRRTDATIGGQTAELDPNTDDRIARTDADAAEDASDSEEVIRKIIRDREESFNKVERLCVVEEPEENEESGSSQESEDESVQWTHLRKSMEELRLETQARSKSITAKRKDLRNQVLQLLSLSTDSVSTVSTAAPLGGDDSMEKQKPLVDLCDRHIRDSDVRVGKKRGKSVRARQGETNQDRVRRAAFVCEDTEDDVFREIQRALATVRSDANVVLLLKSSTKSKIEALYEVDASGDCLLRLTNTASPEVLKREMVQCYYHFSPEFGSFSMLPDRHFAPTADAIVLCKRR